ncbi:hypothetical protein CCACVL1_26033 [Corchorus capsularis]|uniref:Chalcone-flavanone isomerase family protein n=1 Tax=Corchorus capsularis TaxID=210143 RepID=A0A1R3GG66_COCAP|nr:hypothetical protein CCACVL1_26033 [Corchorus capsularis]
METPSRRVTRSQTSAALNNSFSVSKGKNEEESEKSVSKTRTRNGKQQQQERSALIDITNDSPIVGLAMETPSSAIAKQKSIRAKIMMTPGSGEALLRGQVKTLLQKVEEEAELSKVSMEARPFVQFQGCVNSPMAFLAPTPANTPQISNLSEETGGNINNKELGSIVMGLPVVEEHLRISEVVSGLFDGKQEMSLESQKSLIKTLLLDFSEKSESSSDSTEESSSVITGEEGSATKEKASLDDDSSSIWSLQVNASTHDGEEDDEVETIEELGDDYFEEEDVEEEEEEEDDDGGFVDELCEGFSKMNMEEMFAGKHTRFVYNSDDEIEEESILRLKGLPTPKGKHLRFPIEEQDD